MRPRQLFIALTGANSSTLKAARAHLSRSIAHVGAAVVVLDDVRSPSEIAAFRRARLSWRGEVWRVGLDDSKPELDSLIDRAIEDRTPERLLRDVNQALRYATSGPILLTLPSAPDLRV